MYIPLQPEASNMVIHSFKKKTNSRGLSMQPSRVPMLQEHYSDVLTHDLNWSYIVLSNVINLSLTQLFTST
jgi:hypothetical protein